MEENGHHGDSELNQLVWMAQIEYVKGKKSQVHKLDTEITKSGHLVKHNS